MSKMRSKVAQVVAARNCVKLAQARLEQRMRDVFPVGSDIAWEIRYKLLGRGKVVDHGYGGDVFAVNAKTGTRCRVSPYQITKAADYEI